MIDYAVVIPTIGRPGLADLVAAVDGEPAPSRIVVADDRREATSALDLPATSTPLVVVRTHGRGPAATIPVDWCRRLVKDLEDLPDNVAASQAWIYVPSPEGRRPTDAERRTLGLSGALWITADMAYRRAVLVEAGGFDERFSRAFREDADLALRTVRSGYGIAWGERVTTHPLASSVSWRSSLKDQAGNADNALMRAKYGRRWRSLIATTPGRTGRHLLATAAATAAIAAVASHRIAGAEGPFSVARRHSALVAAAAGVVRAALTAEFAAIRILPGPRTASEISTMLITSALIPPVAVAHRLRGELLVRLAWRGTIHRAPAGQPRAVLAPEQCLMIGDIGSDVEAALAAGARGVLVPTRKTKVAEIDHAQLVAAVAPNLRTAVRRHVGRSQ